MSNPHSRKVQELLKKFQAILEHHETQQRNGIEYPIPDLPPVELQHLEMLAARRSYEVGIFSAGLKDFCKSCAQEIHELYGDEYSKQGTSNGANNVTQIKGGR